ncbi:hypothetical protein P3S67_002374 [Capsicum chacoense]
MLEQHEEVELGEMELEISSSKVNPMIRSPDSTCWQIEQAWEPDMLSFDWFLLPAFPIEDFTLWSDSWSPTTTTHHNHDHQESVTCPCDPCADLYYNFHLERGTSNVDLGDDTRFMEFYNLVFMEYNKKDDGSLELLKQKNIDTGLSLERVARILQKVYHTASHLLQSALKRVIVQETSQAGSMVAFDRLRFDFNFH